MRPLEDRMFLVVSKVLYKYLTFPSHIFRHFSYSEVQWNEEMVSDVNRVRGALALRK